MTEQQRKERLEFVQGQILLLRGYLSNPDTLINISTDGISENWVSRESIRKELKALETEESRLMGRGGGRLKVADTRRIAGGF